MATSVRAAANAVPTTNERKSSATTTAAVRERLSFIDWMKAAGIFIIVADHEVALAFNWMTPPILPKQFGVAFFIFVMGYTLAQEQRPAWRVLYNRLFDVYLYGALCALIWSVVGWTLWRDIAESNYLPLIGGVNVLFNFFPANPTTWYIGTYLHVLLLWAFVLRRVQVRPWMLIATAAAEIAIRAVLIERFGGVLPYQLISDWLLVLMLGLYAGQHRAGERGGSWKAPLVAMIAVLGGWHLVFGRFFTGGEFPWMKAPMLGAAGPWFVALLVTVLYSGMTLLLFAGTRRMPTPAVVAWFARHTLFIFIAHMPVYYIVGPLLVRAGWSYEARSVALVLISLPGLAALSSLVARLMPSVLHRDRALALVTARLSSLSEAL